MTPDEARDLMHRWTASPALRAHMEAVAACMGAYADRIDPAHRNDWLVTGLLHDFDYEKHPSKDEHPFVGVRKLEEMGVEDGIRRAILGHATYSGQERDTPMARALFAVDELAGFIVACAKVRPDRLDSLEPRSVKKKLKDRAFAAAVSREDIALGLAELKQVADIDEDAHLRTCIEAIRAAADRVPV